MGIVGLCDYEVGERRFNLLRNVEFSVYGLVSLLRHDSGSFNTQRSLNQMLSFLE